MVAADRKSPSPTNTVIKYDGSVCVFNSRVIEGRKVDAQLFSVTSFSALANVSHGTLRALFLDVYAPLPSHLTESRAFGLG